MIPSGRRRRISSSGRLYGWISEYTLSSRTRRAMSCVYCDPKSRMRTTSRPSPALLFDGIVGRLLGDDHVVDVALAQAGRGDAHEARLLAQLVDALAPHVAHPRAQAAEELVDRVGERPLVGDAPLDPLG